MMTQTSACPISVPGIHGQAREVIAVAEAAQLLPT